MASTTTASCLLLLCLSCILQNARAMPMLPSCAANITKTPAECCPIPPGHKHPCGFPTRGVCRIAQSYKEPLVIPAFKYYAKHDTRVHWPHRVFQRHCECLDKYWGQDCGECWFGYEGANCHHRVVYKRKRASLLTAAEKKYFREVLAKAYTLPSRYVVPTGSPKNRRISGPFKNTTIIESLAFFHWFAVHELQTKNHSLCEKILPKNRQGFCHGQPNFPFFHRLYILLWEREMQKVARKYFSHGNWTWPYWDWTDAKRCDVCTDDFVGSETGAFDAKSGGFRLSPKSVFHNWQAFCSSLYKPPCSGCYDAPKKKVYVSRRWISNKFPTAADVRLALSIPRLYNMTSLCHSFSHYLESGIGCFCNPKDIRLHRQVHLMVNGSMRRIQAAASDPLFYLHHVNIDRLYTRWHRRVRPSKFEIPTYKAFLYGGCRECAIVGVVPPVTNEDMMTNTVSLGYEYEDLDFGSVKASEKIASGFNTFVAPKEKGCPLKKKRS